MKQNKKPLSKKVLALGGVALVGAGALLGALAFPKTVTETQIQEVVKLQNVTLDLTQEQKDAAFNEGVDSVELPDVEAEKVAAYKAGAEEVLEDMNWFIQRLEDKEVIDDAEDAYAEVRAEDVAIKAAFEFVENNEEDLFYMLDKAGIVKDFREVEVIRVYDDFDDVDVIKSEFDNEEYKFNLGFKIEDTDDDEKKNILVKVVIEDGDIEMTKVVEE